MTVIGFDLDTVTVTVAPDEPPTRAPRTPVPSVPTCEVCGWPLIMPWTVDTPYCSVSCKVTEEVKS